MSQGGRLLVQSPNRTESHMIHYNRLTQEQRYNHEAMKQEGGMAVSAVWRLAYL